MPETVNNVLAAAARSNHTVSAQLLQKYETTGSTYERFFNLALYHLTHCSYADALRCSRRCEEEFLKEEEQTEKD